jgi:vacuolar-type H+-ATPase subunit E/Vma4
VPAEAAAATASGALAAAEQKLDWAQDAIRKQSDLSARAAILASAPALAQAIAMLLTR